VARARSSLLIGLETRSSAIVVIADRTAWPAKTTAAWFLF